MPKTDRSSVRRSKLSRQTTDATILVFHTLPIKVVSGEAAQIQLTHIHKATELPATLPPNCIVLTERSLQLAVKTLCRTSPPKALCIFDINDEDGLNLQIETILGVRRATPVLRIVRPKTKTQTAAPIQRTTSVWDDPQVQHSGKRKQTLGDFWRHKVALLTKGDLTRSLKSLGDELMERYAAVLAEDYPTGKGMARRVLNNMIQQRKSKN